MSGTRAETAAFAESHPAKAAKLARAASRKLALLSEAARNRILEKAAARLEENSVAILAANEKDVRAAKELMRTGKISATMLARLRVTETSVREMAEKVRGVARLPDPLGRRLMATELDAGLVLTRETCPLGVVAVVFESRPDVVPQVASLALKSGNAILLKGGTEAAHSNESIVAVWRKALRRFPDVPQESIHLLQSRSDVLELLRLRGEVDLLVPRGSKEFVAFMEQNSRIPVVGHGEGICHVFVDRAADLNRAVTVTLDSKVQYPAACNSVETLLVHKDVAGAFLPRVVAELNEANVEGRGWPRVLALLPEVKLVPAIEKDWSTEYSELILSVKIVDTVEQALEHIQKYGSKDTQSNSNEDQAVAER